MWPVSPPTSLVVKGIRSIVGCVNQRSLAVVTASLLSLGLVGAAAPAASAVPVKKYASCAALNKHYPAGVGLPGAKDKVSGRARPVTNFTRNAAVYKLNKAKLDRDKDGIACEKRTSAAKPAPKPKPPALVQFSDPTGSILCAMSTNPERKGTWKVTCMQLRLMTQAKYKKLCAKQPWQGVTTRAEGTGWNCARKPSAQPFPGQPGTHWVDAKTPVVQGKYGFTKGKRLVVLSAQRNLKLGTVACSQTKTSTTCSNSATRQGFTLTPDGKITWRGVKRVQKFGDVAKA